MVAATGFRPVRGGHRVPAVLAAPVCAAGTTVSHAPDFFARRRDGSAVVVVDCRPVERRRPRGVAKFEARARACALVGWEYRLLGAPDGIVTANLRSLASYRHPRHHLPETVEVLRRVFNPAHPLREGLWPCCSKLVPEISQDTGQVEEIAKGVM